MNHYTELLTYLRQLALSDELVNKVTQGYFEDMDLDKMGFYPLVHIQINEASFSNGSTVSFSIQIGAMGLRDIVKTDEDKYLGDSNEVDNYNEMLAILNRMWNKMYVDFDSEDIQASENPSLTKVTYDYGKGVDGWIISFDVEMPNTTIRLCQ